MLIHPLITRLVVVSNFSYNKQFPSDLLMLANDLFRLSFLSPVDSVHEQFKLLTWYQTGYHKYMLGIGT